MAWALCADEAVSERNTVLKLINGAETCEPATTGGQLSEDSENREPREDVSDRAPKEPVIPARGKRVLVLEDDTAFKEVLRDYLVEIGYNVVAVKSGIEGIREVLARDFDVILCDMMMPGMTGEVFYHAVEKARPYLCGRFVFMTGHRANTRANDFIQGVNGCGLLKPFPLDELRETIQFVEKRGRFSTTWVPRTSDAPDRSDYYARPVVPVRENAWLIANAVSEGDTGENASSASGRKVRTVVSLCAGAAIFAVLATFGFRSYFDLRKRVAASSDEVRILEQHWQETSKQMQETEAVRARIEGLLERPERLAEDHAMPRWAAALRGVASAARKGIEIQGVQANGKAGKPGWCELRIRGISTGAVPRLIADGFLQALPVEIGRNLSGGPVTASFERLEDEPNLPDGSPQHGRATFTIVANVGSTEPKASEGMEKND
jgi:CheY-like chemotaxis protein